GDRDNVGHGLRPADAEALQVLREPLRSGLRAKELRVSVHGQRDSRSQAQEKGPPGCVMAKEVQHAPPPLKESGQIAARSGAWPGREAIPAKGGGLKPVWWDNTGRQRRESKRRGPRSFC